MYDIDKNKLGAFIAQLRKEKGYTQKDLADKLFISNKAVSKWETGASIPDTTLLIPLADLLGVTVTELLTYQRITPNTPIDSTQVENLVKAAINYTEEEKNAFAHNRRSWSILYFASVFLCIIEFVFLYVWNTVEPSQLILVALSIFFGGYFCLFAKPKLPTYYDDNKINFYSDGPFRMNVPGVSFNNSNWPHVLQAVRIWSTIVTVGYPIFLYLFQTSLPAHLQMYGNYCLLLLFLAGLFIPIYYTGKKYQ